ncbi:MAG: helix-turn-helix domain-containing protein [Streptosporangiaceae bacterium]
MAAAVPAGWCELAWLRAALDLSPAAYGWDEDQRWTLSWVAALIGRLFHLRYTLRSVSYLLHRVGFSPQKKARKALELTGEAEEGVTPTSTQRFCPSNSVS